MANLSYDPLISLIACMRTRDGAGFLADHETILGEQFGEAFVSDLHLVANRADGDIQAAHRVAARIAPDATFNVIAMGDSLVNVYRADGIESTLTSYPNSLGKPTEAQSILIAASYVREGRMLKAWAATQGFSEDADEPEAAAGPRL